ncbi:MAG: branched-chain amino acid ABC transporter permease [Chloroflexi bacterium]|nr:branched-chain amino acid ABC transporter permease [Chloroflexota bacterium]
MEQLIQHVINGAMVGSTYAVVAVGFALTFSVLRVINVAHPEVFMLAMFTGLVVVQALTQNFLIVLVIAATAALVAGLAIERAVLRPLRRADLLMPMIATAGVSVFLQYGVQGVAGPDELRFPRILPFAPLEVGAITVTSLQLITFGIAVLILLACSFYVRRTRWGLAARAVAERPDIAATFGVNVSRVAQITVGLSSFMAGAAGVGIAVLYGSAWSFVGLLYGLKSWVCMLVAGNRHIEAVMLVGIMLGILEALTTAYVSSSFRDAVAFVVLIVVLYKRPDGLFGSYSY